MSSRAAVLVRQTWLGPRGFVLDVPGERWPEPGALFHVACFTEQFGRGALWAAFARGRLDKGVASKATDPASGTGEVQVSAPDSWTLSVACADCGRAVAPDGPAVMREHGSRPRWVWAPVLQERRPGQTQVCHLPCFVRTRGRNAAYAALGRQAWTVVGPLVKGVGGAING